MTRTPEDALYPDPRLWHGGYSLAYPICANWHGNPRLWQPSATIFIDLTAAKFSRGEVSSTVYDYDYDFFRGLPLIWDQNKSNLATPSGYLSPVTARSWHSKISSAQRYNSLS